MSSAYIRDREEKCFIKRSLYKAMLIFLASLVTATVLNAIQSVDCKTFIELTAIMFSVGVLTQALHSLICFKLRKPSDTLCFCDPRQYGKGLSIKKKCRGLPSNEKQ